MSDDAANDDQMVGPKRTRWSRLLNWKVAAGLVLLLLIVAACTPAAFRSWRLAQVPEIGDPFPVSEILQQIPMEENAFPLFADAWAMRRKVTDTDAAQYDAELDDGGWDATDKMLNKYLTLNRPALEKWREGAARGNYQVIPVTAKLDDYGNGMVDVSANRDLHRSCQFEIERLTEIDRTDDALQWMRSSFRASALVTRNGDWLDYQIGVTFFSISMTSAERWMRHANVGRDDLLNLISVVDRAARLIERPSRVSQVDYLTSRNRYGRNWRYYVLQRQSFRGMFVANNGSLPIGSRSVAWVLAEPEFSRRLASHVAANHFAYVDKPRRERPPLLDDDLFDDATIADIPAQRLTARKLNELLKQSRLINADIRSLIARRINAIDRKQARLSCLRVALAAQAYFRDRGEFPNQLDELEPDYLASLPDDPFAPQPAPLIYRRTGDEAAVYSRFSNEIDDGGNFITYSEARGTDLRDFGIRIRTPHDAAVVAPDP